MEKPNTESIIEIKEDYDTVSINTGKTADTSTVNLEAEGLLLSCLS